MILKTIKLDPCKSVLIRKIRVPISIMHFLMFLLDFTFPTRNSSWSKNCCLV